MIKKRPLVHITYCVRAAINDIQAAGAFILMQHKTPGLWRYATEVEVAAFVHLMYILHYYQQWQETISYDKYKSSFSSSLWPQNTIQ